MSEPTPKPIRILIVDDHQVVRLGLQTLFQRYPQIKVVGEAGTVAEANRVVQQLKPDVVLLDIRLPDGSGFDVARHIQQSQVESRVLILTAVADEQFVFDAIACGADGYLLKEIGGDGLVKAIERIAAGQSILDPAVTRRVLGRVRKESEAPTAGSKLEKLSPQELRVVALVAEGKTNKEIALALGLSDKTVKNYLSNVFEKLQFSRRSQAAVLFTQNSQS
ncbi:MAG: response regulator transcription factor [Verrucomicrobia bacterium]|nr:response regulator transcription factor [Verrucomicrobiota bacterium]